MMFSTCCYVHNYLTIKMLFKEFCNEIQQQIFLNLELTDLIVFGSATKMNPFIGPNIDLFEITKEIQIIAKHESLKFGKINREFTQYKKISQLHEILFLKNIFKYDCHNVLNWMINQKRFTSYDYFYLFPRYDSPKIFKLLFSQNWLSYSKENENISNEIIIHNFKENEKSAYVIMENLENLKELFLGLSKYDVSNSTNSVSVFIRIFEKYKHDDQIVQLYKEFAITHKPFGNKFIFSILPLIDNCDFKNNLSISDKLNITMQKFNLSNFDFVEILLQELNIPINLLFERIDNVPLEFEFLYEQKIKWLYSKGYDFSNHRGKPFKILFCLNNKQLLLNLVEKYKCSDDDVMVILITTIQRASKNSIKFLLTMFTEITLCGNKVVYKFNDAISEHIYAKREDIKILVSVNDHLNKIADWTSLV